VIERSVDVPTADGEMRTFVYHPEHGGPHPVVLYLMDAPGIRGVLKEMATRLASAGYYVLLPYLFHRGGPFREFTASDEDMHARRELMGTVTPPASSPTPRPCWPSPTPIPPPPTGRWG
jgi:carboxymethylenebutenolidase